MILTTDFAVLPLAPPPPTDTDGGYGGFENAVDDILDELEGNGTNPAPGTGSARGGLPAVPQRKNTIGRNSRQFVSNVRNREARQSVQYSELKERYSTLRRETSRFGKRETRACVCVGRGGEGECAP